MCRRWRWFLLLGNAAIDVVGEVVPHADVPGRYRRPMGEDAVFDARVTSRCDGAIVYEWLDQKGR